MKPLKPRASAIDTEAIAGKAVALVKQRLRSYESACLPPDFLKRIQRFAGMLAVWGSRTNLTARPDDPAEIAFHILDSLAPILLASSPAGSPLCGLFDAGRAVLDVGSGAGFPGLILAAASQARFTLYESRRKRATFLLTAAGEMGLRNVNIEAGPATPRRFKPTFDVVTTRALGALPGFYRIAASALRDAGVAILYVSAAQRLDFESARSSGLRKTSQLAYALERRGESVKRSLVILGREP